VSTKNYLFSYGSLQNYEIQIALYNRKLVGFEAILFGYKISKQKIEGQYLIIYQTQDLNDRITGMVYEISDNELLKTDDYEGDFYKRVQIKLESGITAWCYVMQK
tara:strand:- start:210829 stop:211143 length:315 start_codon:yes stop_codon:yes gene_type:complete